MIGAILNTLRAGLGYPAYLLASQSTVTESTACVRLTIGVELLELLDVTAVELCEAITRKVNVRLVTDIVYYSTLWELESLESAHSAAQKVSSFLHAWCLASCGYPVGAKHQCI